MIKGPGIRFEIGPFNVELKTKIPALANNVYQLYSHSKLLGNNDFVDFHISLTQPNSIRRFVRPQVDFLFDQTRPFKPLALDQACAFFEWGLNWAIAQHAMQFLIIHCAVVEKEGRAVILPGMPGAGKSTLCAALSHHGWRLLSDEQALISLETGLISPLARPICLKNESIDIIRGFCPDAEYGAIVRGTTKGDLAHIKAPTSAISAIKQVAAPSLIIFPQFDNYVDNIQVDAMTRGIALIELIGHCFNYITLGDSGFATLSDTVAQSNCYQLRYRDLNQALATIEALHQEARV